MIPDFDLKAWKNYADDCLAKAKTSRTKADAMSKVGRPDEQSEALAEAQAHLKNALNELPFPDQEFLDTIETNWATDRTQEQDDVINDLIEVYGSLGGILRRIPDRRAALESYGKGARLEKYFARSSTYNRMNEIKYRIIARVSGLAPLKTEIKEVRDRIEDALNIVDKSKSPVIDSAWAWADLGDSRLLLGDVEGARLAYNRFVQKSDTKSPDKAVQVLRDLSEVLDESEDSMAKEIAIQARSLIREFQN